MRVVVFTELADLECTPWWAALQEMAALERVLVVRKVYAQTPREVLRRLRRNIRKHGWAFVPYRLGVLVGSLAARALRGGVAPARPQVPRVPTDRVESADVHAPEVLARVAEFQPDLGVSIGAPVLRAALFHLPARGTINVHLGSVPDFRGAPPGFWELWHDAREVGATVHWMDEGLDTGDVIAAARAPIYPADTPARLEARAAELGLTLFRAALDRLANGETPRARQPPGGRTHRFPTLRQRFALWRNLALRRARRRLASPLYPVKIVAVAASLAVVRPLRDLWRTLRGTHPVRVFTFHRVTDLCRDGMTVPPDVFERQLAYLCRRHEVVGLDAALRLLASGARLRRPAAALTFDDGYRSVYDAAWPLMQRLGVPGTCFVSTGLVATTRRFEHDAASPVREHLGVMDWDQLAVLRDAGWQVGGHTASHARLAHCDEAALHAELDEPVRALRGRLGVTAPALAYPFGGPEDITPDGIRVARDAGYRACFSDYGGENFGGDDLFALRRIELGGDHDTLAWRAAVHGIDLRRWRRRLAGAPT